MKTAFRIGDRQVGDGAPVLVIAEAGSNHDGDRQRALDLVRAAAEAGADAVKFQLFRAERLYPRGAGRADYLGDALSIYELIEAMELPPEWLPQLQAEARARGLAFVATPFHEEAVERLEPLVDAFKIASYELTHAPLLDAVARCGKPVILSCGASTLEETRRAVGRLERGGCDELVVLQCTAAYPAPPAAANVRALVSLRETLGVPTGLSDHTRDPVAAPTAAAALGAAVIEKHFTLSREGRGPDHAYAVEPAELARLVRAVRAVEEVLGDGHKRVHEVERELREFARRSIFTTGAVAEGEAFRRDRVDVLRHGKLAHGLPPVALDRVLASRAARDLPPEHPLAEEDLMTDVRLRRAVDNDCELLFTWANDPGTRAGSFRSEPIPAATHRRWFRSSLEETRRMLRIAEVGGRAVGLVRFDRLADATDAAEDDDALEIGVTVAPDRRGEGLAAALLRAARVEAGRLGARRLVARIRPENAASLRAFEADGYRRRGEETVAGVPAVRYEATIDG